MKKIGMFTMGSEGDIKPFLTVADELQREGYSVTLFITGHDETDYSRYATNPNVKIENIGIFDKEGFDEMMQSLAGASLFKAGNAILEHFVFSKIPTLFEASERLCSENDLVIGHSMNFPLVLEAKKQCVDYITLMPMAASIPTKSYPPMGMPGFGRLGNALLWHFYRIMANLFFVKKINSYSSTYGFSPISDYINDICISDVINIIGVSPSLFNYTPDYCDNAHFVGSLNYNGRAETIPDDLEMFLQGDEPVGFVTIGSMVTVDLNPDETVKLFLDAADISGIKIVLQFDWSRCSRPVDSPNIFTVDRIPHETIFPRCSFVVHHGAAGTTQSTLLAGVPSIVISHGADQGFNGAALKRVGVCKDVFNRSGLKAAKLAKAMRQLVNDERCFQSAQLMSRKLSQENGLKSAVELIKETISKGA